MPERVRELVTRVDRKEATAWSLLVASLALTAFRLMPGPFMLLGSLLLLLATSRQSFLAAVAFGVPASTIGWDLPIAEIGGRTLDARLLITFGMAVLLAAALTIERPRLLRIELVACGLVTWIVIVGLLRSDSVLTWGPPAARWFGYAAVLVLARRWTTTGRQLLTLSGAVTLGFSVPAFLGLAQFIIGDASFMNGAVRATAPGGRGPIGLAFAGQMVVVLAFIHAELRARQRATWLPGLALGTFAIIASATRIATATAWFAVSFLAIGKRRWWTLLGAAIVVVMALAARPELLSRYFATISPGNGPITSPGESAHPSPGSGELILDSSLKFRVFVWRTVLDEWTEDPILGIGPGMTAVAVSQVSPAKRTAPHNDYIGILAETGIPGFAMFVGLQAAVLGYLWRLRRGTAANARRLIEAVAVLFLATNVLGAINNPVYFYDVQVSLWALIGGCIGAFGMSAPSHQQVGGG